MKLPKIGTKKVSTWTTGDNTLLESDHHITLDELARMWDTEKLPKEILEKIPMAVFVADASLNLIQYNRYFCELTGYHRGIEGKKISMFLHDNDCFMRLCEEAVRSNDMKAGECWFRTKKNKIVPVNVHLSYNESQSNRLKYFLCFLQNIQRRKEAEESLRRSERSLSEAQRIAHLGNWELDLVNNDLRWSDEIFRIFGLKPQEFGATYEAFLRAVHPDDRKNVDRSFKSALKNGVPYDIVHRIVRPDGEIRFVHEKAEDITDENGRVVRSVGTVQDITQRIQIEKKVKKLNEKLERGVRQRTAELEATNRELEAFSYSVSHDLRAPLRTIKGYTQVLRDDFLSRLGSEERGYLDTILTTTIRMEQLIEALLKLSRVTRGEMTRVSLDLGVLAEMVALELKRSDPRRRVKFDIKKGLKIRGDLRLMKVALENLIGNAWKFSAGRRITRIEVGMKVDRGEQVFFVKDNGVGFSMKYADKLFTPFQRLHKTDEYKGTGIGLATVKRIIDRHGGTIWVTSQVKKGTTFYFTLGTY